MGGLQPVTRRGHSAEAWSGPDECFAFAETRRQARR